VSTTPPPTPASARPGQAGLVPLHDFLGLAFEWETEPGDTAVVEMPLEPEALGRTGNPHGGAIATMIDLAAALATARASGHDPEVESLVTVDMHIRYLGTPRGGDAVSAGAKVVRAGKQIVVVECRVLDHAGHLIAIADLSMMKVPIRHPRSGA